MIESSNNTPRNAGKKIVLNYIFKGLTHRELDREVLGMDSDITRGYQSMAVLHHYGLNDKFKGIFSDYDYEDVMSILMQYPDYRFLYDIVAGICPSPPDGTITFDDGKRGWNVKVSSNMRINQDSFRRDVLKAYDSSCCITGIHDSQLLIASHIKPWCKSNDREKVDVCNGLCLNALHDLAFDSGMITVMPSTFKLKLSGKIEDMMDESTYEEYFRKYDGTPIKMPHPEYGPAKDYLDYHNSEVFEKKSKKIRVVYEMAIDSSF